MKLIEEELFNDIEDALNDIAIDFGGGCSLEKAYVMAWLIMKFDIKRSIDIGVYRGRSLFPQAIAHKTCTDGTAFGVDPWNSEIAREKDNNEFGDEIEDFLNKSDFECIYEDVSDFKNKKKLNKNCILLRKKSSEAIEYFRKESIFPGLVHIDGNHDIEMVMSDIDLYMPILNEKGFLVLDDVSWDSVKPALDFVSSKYALIYKKVDSKNDFAIFWKNNNEKEVADLETQLGYIAREIRIKDLESVVKKLSESLKIREQEIVYKNNELQLSISESEYLKTSKFWKLRDAYLKIKFAVLSPRKITKKYFELFRDSIRFKTSEILKRKNDLVIIDEYFPNLATAFRVAEYNYYLKKFSNSIVINKKLLDSASYDFTSEYGEYLNVYPQYSDRVFKFDKRRKINANLIYTVFLNNIYHYLPIIEEFGINFVFTLYPGGGFWINNDPEIDRRLSLVFNSPYFKKVIVTQKITYDYLIKNNFCPAEKIEFIFGVVLDTDYYRSRYVEKKYYKKDKNTFDICFVSYKYMERGVDKGYDTFIETAKLLSKFSDDVRFHVVGGFNEKEIDIAEIKEKIFFHGPLRTEVFPEFYSKMDMIISPTVPFKLFPGNFDGFPTGSCSEAAFAGVAVLCSDVLNLNTEFKDKEDIRIIPNDAEKITAIVTEYMNDLESLYLLSDRCRTSFLRVYDIENQMDKRMKILKEYI